TLHGSWWTFGSWRIISRSPVENGSPGTWNASSALFAQIVRERGQRLTRKELACAVDRVVRLERGVEGDARSHRVGHRRRQRELEIVHRRCSPLGRSAIEPAGYDP